MNTSTPSSDSSAEESSTDFESIDQLPEEPLSPLELGPLEMMSQASQASDIAKAQRLFPEPECNAAWQALDPVQRSALLLTRFFPGSVIIRDLDHDLL